MTEEEAQTVAKEAAREAVHETLQLIGLDIQNPHELQRDFNFVRSWRQSSEAVKRQGLLTAVGIITTGIIALIVMAVRGTTSSP